MMGIDKLIGAAIRIFFLAAFALLLIAVWERIVNSFGYSFLGTTYTPGRMLEFAGVLLLFVIAGLLRQMRDERRSPGR